MIMIFNLVASIIWVIFVWSISLKNIVLTQIVKELSYFLWVWVQILLISLYTLGG